MEVGPVDAGASMASACDDDEEDLTSEGSPNNPKKDGSNIIHSSSNSLKSKYAPNNASVTASCLRKSQRGTGHPEKSVLQRI